ncbi:MAG: hypothetical protein ABWZ40_11635 [Caulobacterales bacterium]
MLTEFGDGVLAFQQGSTGIALGAALVALLSLTFNWALLRRFSAEQKARIASERDANMLRWSEEAINVLADAERLCAQKNELFKPDEFHHRQSDAVTALSALLDRGQLFYPNADTDRYANRRASAGPGHKQDAMEALFQAYLTLRNVEAQDKGPGVAAAAQRLFEHRKLFVEEVYGGIDLRRRRAALTDPENRKAERASQARRRAEPRQAPPAAA